MLTFVNWLDSLSTLTELLLWQTCFCITTSSNKKSETCKSLEYYQTFLTLKNDLCYLNNDEFKNNYNDIYPSWLESKKQNEDSSKALLLKLSIKVHEILHSSCFMKERFFLFTSLACLIWVATYDIKYFVSVGSEILHIIRTKTDLTKLIARVNLSLICLEKRESECTHHWKKVFGKHFEMFYKYADTTNEFVNFCPL